MTGVADFASTISNTVKGSRLGQDKGREKDSRRVCELRNNAKHAGGGFPAPRSQDNKMQTNDCDKVKETREESADGRQQAAATATNFWNQQ